jgi:hypothetical protein
MPRPRVGEKVAPPVESPAHQRLLDLVRSRRSLSARKLANYYPEWTKADRIYQHYVEPSETDSQGKRLYPWARSIVVPMSYAIVQTQLAWEMAAFTQRIPIVPLDGLSPEDVKPAKVMEQVLQHEWSTDRMALSLYQWLLDRRRYGLGVVWINWARDATRQRVEVPKVMSLPFLGIELPLGTEWEWQDRVKYEGNRLEPIDPFRFYPDPRVALADAHRGEFVGFRTQKHYHELLLQERDGQYANVKRLPKRPNQGGVINTSQAPTMEPRALDRSGVGLGDWMGQIGPNSVDFQERGSVTLDVFVIRLVPKDYELGDSSWPQKYVVVVGNEAIVLRAQPYEFDHDELPACVMELSADRHMFSTPGVVSHLEDLQDFLSWLYNSHAENVRRTLNNQFIVDPSLVHIEDLLQPQPGLLARLRREAQGRPGSMEQAIKQIPIMDVTKTHGQDMSAAIDLMQRVSAAPENLQGVLAKGEKTLGEQQMAVSAAQGRLRMEAQMGWLQGMVRATHQRISNIQQFMSEERWIQVVGTYPLALGLSADTKFLRVGPDQVQGQFTYSQPDMIVRQDQPMLMALREIWMAVAKEPELRQRFDLVKLFEPMAQMAGIKNLSDYVREMPAAGAQTPIPGMPSFGMPGNGGGGTPPGMPTPQGPVTPKVMPDEDVMRQVEAGNLVPMG